jgi:hypothetical protein
MKSHGSHPNKWKQRIGRPPAPINRIRSDATVTRGVFLAKYSAQRGNAGASEQVSFGGCYCKRYFKSKHTVVTHKTCTEYCVDWWVRYASSLFLQPLGHFPMSTTDVDNRASVAAQRCLALHAFGIIRNYSLLLPIIIHHWRSMSHSECYHSLSLPLKSFLKIQFLPMDLFLVQ